MDLQLDKKRVRIFLFVAGIVALSITYYGGGGDILGSETRLECGSTWSSSMLIDLWQCGRGGSSTEKCRQMVGEQASSKSGKFTVLNCLDMGSGTLACAVKESVKMYFYNLQNTHVEMARSQAIESALADATSQGKTIKDAAKQAQKEGKKAAKLASREAKRVIGPIMSSGWDFFEALYFGGSMAESFSRGSGTLVGTFVGGSLGEQRLGRFGYFLGSHLGSWVGGRIGLMIYDVVNGINYLLQFAETAENDSYAISRDSSAEYVDSGFPDEL